MPAPSLAFDRKSTRNAATTPSGRSQMPAFIWVGNPTKWSGSGSMESYLLHPSGYVYWSTPPRQASHVEISPGTRAYLWRTLSNGLPRGIIGLGVVEEPPQPLSSKSKFLHPERVDAPGWSERDASSEWKTGISFENVRLAPSTGMLSAEELAKIVPGLGILKNPRGTVFRVDEEQSRLIDDLWESKRP